MARRIQQEFDAIQAAELTNFRYGREAEERVNASIYLNRRAVESGVLDCEEAKSATIQSTGRHTRERGIVNDLAPTIDADIEAVSRNEVPSYKPTAAQIAVVHKYVPGLNEPETVVQLTKYLAYELPGYGAEILSSDTTSRVTGRGSDDGSSIRMDGMQDGSDQLKALAKQRQEVANITIDVSDRSAALQGLAQQRMDLADHLLALRNNDRDGNVSASVLAAQNRVYKMCTDLANADRAGAPQLPPNIDSEEMLADRSRLRNEHEKKMVQYISEKLVAPEALKKGYLSRVEERDKLAAELEQELASREQNIKQCQEDLAQLDNTMAESVVGLQQLKEVLQIEKAKLARMEAVMQGAALYGSSTASAGAGKTKKVKLTRVRTGPGTSEALEFLPLLKMLLIFRFIVSITSRKEVEATTITQGSGPGVPPDETAASYERRYRDHYIKRRLHGIPCEFETGLLSGLRYKAVHQQVQTLLIGRDTHSMTDREFVALIERAERLYLENRDEKERRDRAGPRHTAAVAAEQQSQQQQQSAFVTDLSNRLKDMERQLANDKRKHAQPAATPPTPTTPSGDWPQGRNRPCRRCHRMHSEAVPCWPRCNTCTQRHPAGTPCLPECGRCNRRHRAGTPCFEHCNTCNRYHLPGPCPSGYGRGRGRGAAPGRHQAGGRAAAAPGRRPVEQAHVMDEADHSGWLDSSVMYSHEDEQDEQPAMLMAHEGASSSRTASLENRDCQLELLCCGDVERNPGPTDSTYCSSCCAGLNTAAYAAVQVADIKMQSPLPESFVPRHSQRLAERRNEPLAVLQRTQRSSRMQPQDKENQPPVTSAAAKTQHVNDWECPEQHGILAKPQNATVFVVMDPQNKQDSKMTQTLAELASRYGLAVVALPGEVLRTAVAANMCEVEPAVMATEAALTAAESFSDHRLVQQYIANWKADTPTLPYAADGVGAVHNPKTGVLIRNLKIMFDSGASRAVLALKAVAQCGVHVTRDGRLISAVSGSIATEGQAKHVRVQLKLMDGSLLKLVCPATVMGGQQETYDLILGRYEMHRMGMRLDFFTQQAWVRPHLSQGSDVMTELGIQCTTRKSEDAAILAVLHSLGNSASLEDRDMSLELVRGGDVELNPGPTSSGPSGSPVVTHEQAALRRLQRNTTAHLMTVIEEHRAGMCGEIDQYWQRVQHRWSQPEQYGWNPAGEIDPITLGEISDGLWGAVANSGTAVIKRSSRVAPVLLRWHEGPAHEDEFSSAAGHWTGRYLEADHMNTSALLDPVGLAQQARAVQYRAGRLMGGLQPYHYWEGHSRPGDRMIFAAMQCGTAATVWVNWLPPATDEMCGYAVDAMRAAMQILRSGDVEQNPGPDPLSDRGYSFLDELRQLQADEIEWLRQHVSGQVRQDIFSDYQHEWMGNSVQSRLQILAPGAQMDTATLEPEGPVPGNVVIAVNVAIEELMTICPHVSRTRTEEVTPVLLEFSQLNGWVPAYDTSYHTSELRLWEWREFQQLVNGVRRTYQDAVYYASTPRQLTGTAMRALVVCGDRAVAQVPWLDRPDIAPWRGMRTTEIMHRRVRTGTVVRRPVRRPMSQRTRSNTASRQAAIRGQTVVRGVSQLQAQQRLARSGDIEPNPGPSQDRQDSQGSLQTQSSDSTEYTFMEELQYLWEEEVLILAAEGNRAASIAVDTSQSPANTPPGFEFEPVGMVPDDIKDAITAVVNPIVQSEPHLSTVRTGEVTCIRVQQRQGVWEPEYHSNSHLSELGLWGPREFGAAVRSVCGGRRVPFYASTYLQLWGTPFRLLLVRERTAMAYVAWREVSAAPTTAGGSNKAGPSSRPPPKQQDIRFKGQQLAGKQPPARRSSQRLAQQRLMQSGDIESNPGPHGTSSMAADYEVPALIDILDSSDSSEGSDSEPEMLVTGGSEPAVATVPMLLRTGERYQLDMRQLNEAAVYPDDIVTAAILRSGILHTLAQPQEIHALVAQFEAGMMGMPAPQAGWQPAGTISLSEWERMETAVAAAATEYEAAATAETGTVVTVFLTREGQCWTAEVEPEVYMFGFKLHDPAWLATAAISVIDRARSLAGGVTGPMDYFFTNRQSFTIGPALMQAALQCGDAALAWIPWIRPAEASAATYDVNEMMIVRSGDVQQNPGPPSGLEPGSSGSSGTQPAAASTDAQQTQPLADVFVSPGSGFAWATPDHRVVVDTGASRAYVRENGVSREITRQQIRDMLLRAGDVEQNPGPARQQNSKGIEHRERNRALREVLQILVCFITLLLAVVELALGEWPKCCWVAYLSGVVAIHAIMKMVVVLGEWRTINSEDSYAWIMPWLPAKVRRKVRRYEKQQEHTAALLGHGRRSYRRLKRLRLVPLFTVGLLALLAMASAAVATHVKISTISMPATEYGMAAEQLVWAKELRSPDRQGYSTVGSLWQDKQTSEAVLVNVLPMPHAHPVHALQEYEPAGSGEQKTEQNVYIDPDGQFQFSLDNNMTEEQRKALQQAVTARKHAFAYSMKDLPGTTRVVGWKMKDDSPIFSPCHARRGSPLEEEIKKAKVSELEEADIVEETSTDKKYASHATCAAKKNAETGEWCEIRYCVDYRRTNNGMVTDNYTAPLPEQIFAQAAGCTVFTRLDARAGFHQLTLDEASRDTTCFWSGRRLMRYKRCPYGIKNALPIYQRVMDELLSGTGIEGGHNCTAFAMAYVDDVLIMSDEASHAECVAKVLDNLHAGNLRLHPTKCLFGAKTVEFLGHQLKPEGMGPLAVKVSAIDALPEPNSVQELQHVMGIINYYRCYLPNASAVASPINMLTKKDQPWVWGTAQRKAFKQLKEMLKTAPVLRNADPNRPFILHTDWSVKGIGAVLGQLDDDGNEYMVACASRSLNEHEKNYTPWKGELLAATFGIRTFRSYIIGRHITLVVDHRPLLGLWATAEPNSQQTRFLMILQEADFTIQHREGIKHINADVFSRLPCKDDTDGSGARVDTGPLLKPKMPAVQIGSQQYTGDQALQQLGPDLVDKFAEQWRPKKGSSTAAASPGLAVHVIVANATADEVMLSWEEAEAAEDNCLAAIDLPSGTQYQTWQTQNDARAWVAAAQQTASSSHEGMAGGGDVDTACCAQTFFPWAYKAGVTVFEPFGGMGAGLEMALKQGFVVNRYIYADKLPEARQVMQHRLYVLAGRYPAQLTPSAWAHAFDSPQDVYEYTPGAVQAMVQQGEQWLVIAGWECQDLSAAGSGLGLKGKKSSTYFQLLKILSWLQQANIAVSNPPVAYVLENTAFQFHWDREVSGQIELVNFTLGQPVVLDAARFGSRAHRLRNFWTNLCGAGKLAAAVREANRKEGQLVQDILEPGRIPMPVTAADKQPWYPCNQVGQEREALPTLMAYRGSYNFRQGKPGSVWDQQKQAYDEPMAVERERALGYHDNDTAAPGISEQQRREMLGRCIDANSITALMGTAAAWWDADQHAAAVTAMVCSNEAATMIMASSAAYWEVETANSSWDTIPDTLASPSWCVQSEPAIISNTSTEEMEQAALVIDDADRAESGGVYDPHSDHTLMQYLEQQTVPQGTSRHERDRVGHMAKRLCLREGVLHKVTRTGRLLIIPTPVERTELVEQMHHRCGHYGVRRTLSLLLHSYWWRGMLQDVRHVISRCTQCDRARVSFAGLNPQLQSLPVQGQFYRWHVDLITKLPESKSGNTVIMVMVDAYTKVLEVAPLPAKKPEYTARAFHEHVIGRYGAPAQVVTDQGPEFQSDFGELLVRYYIDHTPTTANHPQGNGAAERAVQIVKRSLRKVVELEGTVKDWEQHLPDLVLGYNSGVQLATGFAPFTLVYGVPPVLPAARRERLSEQISFDDQEAAANELIARMELMRRYSVMAGGNQLIAQRRDQLKYARRRDGTYLPAVKQFQEGDYVYLRTISEAVEGAGLTLPVEPIVLRVSEVRPNGTVELIGRNGQRRVVNMQNISLCHLPNINGEIDWTLLRPPKEFACSRCGSPDNEADLLLCDGCGKGYHTWCLQPQLAAIPEGAFICPDCTAAGVTEAEVNLRQQESAQQQEAKQKYRDFKKEARPTALQKRRDAANAAMHGRLVKQGTKWGRIHYRGPGAKDPYLVVYADGSTEDCNNHHISKRVGWLQTANTKLPARVSIPEPAVTALMAAESVQMLSTQQQWEQLLQQSMPGHWPAAYVKQGWESCMAYQMNIGGQSISSSAVARLFERLKLPEGWQVLDPCAEIGTVVAACRMMGLRTHGNRFADTGMHCLCNTLYDQRSPQAIVTAPPFGLIEVLLPRLWSGVCKVACIAVHKNWLSGISQHPAGRDWLTKALWNEAWCVAQVDAATVWIVWAEGPELLTECMCA